VFAGVEVTFAVLGNVGAEESRSRVSLPFSQACSCLQVHKISSGRSVLMLYWLRKHTEEERLVGHRIPPQDAAKARTPAQKAMIWFLQTGFMGMCTLDSRTKGSYRMSLKYYFFNNHQICSTKFQFCTLIAVFHIDMDRNKCRGEG
jgi:hypothetical protein